MYIYIIIIYIYIITIHKYTLYIYTYWILYYAYIYIYHAVYLYMIYTSKLAPSHHPPPASPSSASPMPHGWVRWAPASRTTWSHCATGCSDRPRSPTAADSAPGSAPARRSPGRSDIGPRPRWGHRHHWGPRHERWPHNLRSLERGVAKDENGWKVTKPRNNHHDFSFALLVSDSY